MLNVAPTATFTGTPGTRLVGQSATLALSKPFDPGAAAVAAGFLYSCDYTKDGTFEIVDSSAASHTCAYPTVGTFTARGFNAYMVHVTVLTPQKESAGLIEQVQVLIP